MSDQPECGAESGSAKARPEGRPRGRPKRLSAAEREEKILDAVESLLIDKGLQATSMAALARAAGMSKRTLYEVFACRGELFEACIRRLRTNFIRPLSPHELDLPVDIRLRRIFEPDMRQMDRRVPMAVLRTVIMEAPQRSELGQAFLREGPDRARAVIRDELARSVARGEIVIDDLDLAARMLCDMVFFNPMDNLVNIDKPPPSQAESEHRLTFAIHVFLNGLRTPDRGTLPAA